MPRFLLLTAMVLFAILLPPASATAASLEENPAAYLASVTQDLLPGSVDEAAVRKQLAAAARLTGEEAPAVAVASIRAARFIFDATKAQASPLDVLDAVVQRGKGRPLAETIGLYVEARRQAPGKTHAEALAAMP